MAEFFHQATNFLINNSYEGMKNCFGCKAITIEHWMQNYYYDHKIMITIAQNTTGRWRWWGNDSFVSVDQPITWCKTKLEQKLLRLKNNNDKKWRKILTSKNPLKGTLKSCYQNMNKQAHTGLQAIGFPWWP